MSFSEVRNIPTAYRRWYINRLLKYFKDINNENKEDVPVSENIRKVDEYISKL
tara:strand:+ start:932 stop:1090 length:159 start_codon:yes stop_codon:yes gene_type:complete